MSNPNENESASTELEVVPITTLEATERASFDIQIATAKRWPRDLVKFKKKACETATMDEEIAESCLYRRPVGKDDAGKPVFAEGMSVRMSEIVACHYGNVRVKTYTVEQTDRFVRVCGQAIDLENNYASSSEISESTVTSSGRPYSERQRLLTAKIAHAKARRDALFQIIPRALAKPVENACRALLFASQLTIDERRSRAISWIGKLGIDPMRVYAALGVNTPAELGKEHLETLTGIRTAIKDKDTTIDEAFPDPKAQKSKSGGLADIIGHADASKAPATPPQTASEPPIGTQTPPAAQEPPKAKETPPVVPAYTAEQRAAFLTECEGAMMSNSVTESRVLKYATEHGLRKPEQDEIGALGTQALDFLRAIIPTLKAAAK